MNKDLLDFAIWIADTYFDGHFTLLKFTGGWKAGFFVMFDESSRENIKELSFGFTKEEAIFEAIKKFNTCYTKFN